MLQPNHDPRPLRKRGFRGHCSRALLFAAAALLCAVAAQAQGPGLGEEEDILDYTGQPFRLTVATGADYSEGKYGGTEDTNTLYVPASLKLELDPFVFRLSVPWVRSSCDLIDDACQGGSQPEQTGIGDVVLGVGYVYFPEAGSSLPTVELSAKVKFGTADRDKGLGTGENDYTLLADFSKGFGALVPFAGFGYRFVGDPPGLDLRDKWLAWAGVAARVNSKVTVGISYDWNQSTVITRPDAHELSPFATIKISRNFSVDPYGVIGLSDNSPDWGLGLQLRFIYDRL